MIILHTACLSGNLIFVKKLIEVYKAKTNLVDRYNRSSLHYASYSGNLSLVKYLVEDIKMDIKLVDCV